MKRVPMTRTLNQTETSQTLDENPDLNDPRGESIINDVEGERRTTDDGREMEMEATAEQLEGQSKTNNVPCDLKLFFRNQMTST